MLSNIHAAKHVVSMSHVRCFFLRQEVKIFLCLIRLQSVNMYGRVDVQDGADETHVFHIRITLFILNIKKF